MKISAKTTATSIAALSLLVLIGGLLFYFLLSVAAENAKISDAEKRMEFLQASIREDSLLMKDRAAKAGLSSDPGSYFPGITYCDVFVYGNSRGDVVDSYIDPGFTKLTPKTILNAYVVEAEEAHASGSSGSWYGIMKVGSSLILFGSAPARSDSFIVVGKVIDTEYERQLTRLNEYTVKITEYNRALGTQEKAAKIEIAKGAAVYVAPGGGEWSNIYGGLRDLAGHPIGLIETVNDTTALPYGAWILFGGIGLMLLTGLGVIIVNLAVVRFGWASRVKQAKDTVAGVRDSSDLSVRLAVTGRDELSDLFKNINTMMAHLGESHHQEFLSQQMYSQLAEATGNQVFVLTPEMDIEFMNSVATAEYGVTRDGRGKPDWFRELSRDQRRRDRQRIQRVFDTGTGERYEEKREFLDETRWVDTWLVPIKNERGKVVKLLVSSQDISERKTAEEKTVRMRDFYIYLFDNFPNPVWRSDAQGRCNYVNKAGVAFTGKDQSQLMNTGWVQSVHKDDAPARAKLLDQAEKTKAHTEIEYRIRGYDGTYRWVIDYVQPIYNLRNRFAGFYGTLVDVTERRMKSEELAYMATHDVLTGTANRRRFDEEIEHAVARAKRGATSVLLFIDLDDFKSINDKYGHHAGDIALAAVAATARGILRKEDVLARLGGDEFAVILEGQSLEAAAGTAGRLAAAVNKKVKVNEAQALTISVGLTAIHEKTTAGRAMAEADAAMYEGKRRGGNRALVFEPGFIDYNY